MSRIAFSCNVGVAQTNGSYKIKPTNASDPADAVANIYGTAGSDMAVAAANMTAAIAAYQAFCAAMLADVFQQQAGGSVTFSNSTLNFSGTPDATASAPSSANQSAIVALWNTFGTAWLLAQSCYATAIADTYAIADAGGTAALATGVTDANLVFTTATVGLNAVFQSTTYTTGTMQGAYAGSTAASITEAHQASLITVLNTAGSALLAAQTAVAAIAATTLSLANAIGNVSTASVVVSINSNVTRSGAMAAVHKIGEFLSGSSGLQP